MDRNVCFGLKEQIRWKARWAAKMAKNCRILGKKLSNLSQVKTVVRTAYMQFRQTFAF